MALRKRARRRRTAPKYLEHEELDRLLQTIARARKSAPGKERAIRDLALFLVAVTHGLRASEVGMLQLGDIHITAGRGTIRIARLKGSSEDVYPLLPPELAALRAWLRLRGSAPGVLFPSRNHRGISRRRLDFLMKHYCALAGIPAAKAHFHMLKHTCATMTGEREENVARVQWWLGHADIRSTMVYLHQTKKSKDELAEKMKDFGRIA